VFKVAAFHFDASVKTSSPLLDCLVNHSLVKFISCRHKLRHTWRSSYKVQDTKWKSFLSKLCAVLSKRQTDIFCTDITFISRAILILSKQSANYE